MIDLKDYYCEILQQTPLPCLPHQFAQPKSHRFMLDNDQKHCSRIAQTFYEEVALKWLRTPP